MKGHLYFDYTTEPATITDFLEFGSEDYSPEKRDPVQTPTDACALLQTASSRRGPHG
jgi:hypothetical protein